MNTIESNPLPVSSKIACCLICTLAEVMKDCKNCPFNVGLKFKNSDPIKKGESNA